MKIELLGCDCCGKRTQDRHAEKGWVHIEPAPTVAISNGRGKDRCARTSGYYSPKVAGMVLDFCSVKCAQDWLAKLKT